MSGELRREKAKNAVWHLVADLMLLWICCAIYVLLAFGGFAQGRAPPRMLKGSPMCISAEALALFLNLLSFDLIDADQQGRIIIHAESRPAHWVYQGGHGQDEWCTMAPQLDAMARRAVFLQDN